MRTHTFTLDALRSLLAVLAILALGGFSEGSCFGPIDDPPPAVECSDDADCGEGFYCDVVGLPEPMPFDDGTTGGGQTEPGHPGDDPGCGVPVGVCLPLHDDCTTDADCGAGEICVIEYEDDLPVCMMYCEVGADCCGVPAPSGTCEPAPTEYCGSDADCGPGEICDIVDLPVECDCAPNELCEMYCTAPAGICIPAPDGCQTDTDCPNGYCEIFATCAGLDCPPPPPNQCVYPNCNDGDEVFCDMVPPTCAPGETLAVQNGCFACLDARTCGPSCDGVACPAGSHCELEGVICFVEPCAPQPICVPDDPPPTCPGENDPRVSYVCTGSECWVIGAWICPAGQDMFSSECGGGCIDTNACDGLDETSCSADEICDPIYGPSHCNGQVCTDDWGYQGCARLF